MTTRVRSKIEQNVIRESYQSRGGGVEISLDNYGFKGEKMSAYQNYLGGGVLGSIQGNDTIRTQSGYRLSPNQEQRLDALQENLKKYYYTCSGQEDEYNNVQLYSASAY